MGDNFNSLAGRQQRAIFIFSRASGMKSKKMIPEYYVGRYLIAHFKWVCKSGQQINCGNLSTAHIVRCPEDITFLNDTATLFIRFPKVLLMAMKIYLMHGGIYVAVTTIYTGRYVNFFSNCPWQSNVQPKKLDTLKWKKNFSKFLN